MSPDINIVNAFSLNGRGGNPAGIAILDQEMNAEHRQAIAKEVGLSETAFVIRENGQEISLRFHTPNREIPNCGHATLAALGFLHSRVLIGQGEVRFRTSNSEGIAMVNDATIFMSQAAPQFDNVNDPKPWLESIGLDQDSLAGDLQIVSTGNRFLMVPIKDGSTLKAIRPNHDQIQKLSNKFNLIGYYPFVASRHDPGRAYARMFAPAYGIPEEAATGMAAGALAGYLDHRNAQPDNHYEFFQGHLMPGPSPSRILVKIDKEEDQITRVWVGGESRYVSTQKLEI